MAIRHSIPPEFAAWRRKWLSQLPSRRTLTRRLDTVLREVRCGPVTVVDREVYMNWNRFSGEIVTCRVPDRGELRVLCKYEVHGEEEADGHHAGLWYEADVYRSILTAAPVPVPAFYGDYVDPETNLRCDLICRFDQRCNCHFSLGVSSTPRKSRFPFR